MAEWAIRKRFFRHWSGQLSGCWYDLQGYWRSSKMARFDREHTTFN